MDDETLNIMNIDLNLDPGQESENTYVVDATENADTMTDETHRFRDFTAVGPGGISPEQNQIMDGLANLSSLPAGEVSATTEDGRNIAPKTCQDEETERNEESAKKDCEDGSSFDCFICLDLAKSPVVTCCGHLFCWSCLHRWLNHRSAAMECPVCKGKVSVKDVTPIYGRGSGNRVAEEGGDSRIPVRPPERKVESSRAIIQRSGFSCPPENTARHLENLPDSTQNLVCPRENENSNERSDRGLSGIMTSRGRRSPLPPRNEMGLVQWWETEENAPLRHPPRRSGQPQRVNAPSPLSALSPGRSPVLDLRLVDRDSYHGLLDEAEDFLASIIAVMSLEDEIDSDGGDDVSRGLDVAGEDVRQPTRRRLD